jgi:hypothetical protein
VPEVRSLLLRFRLSPRERRLIAAAAHQRDQTTSEFTRRAAIAVAEATLTLAAPRPACSDRLSRIETKTAAPATLEHKTSGGALELKAGDKPGEFVVVVYTCPGPDDQGDFIPPSAFHPGDDAVLSQWNHSAIHDSKPAGRGKLSVDGNRVLVSGTFFLDSTVGRDTYETIRGLKERCEYSIGYLVNRWRAPTAAEAKRGVSRVIEDLTVFEISPVTLGAAGRGRTGTVSIKSALAENITNVIGETATREVLTLVNDLIDLKRSHSAEQMQEKRLAVETERMPRVIDRDRRQTAEKAARLAADILGGKPRRIRWLDEGTAIKLNVDGRVWTDQLEEVWINAKTVKPFEVAAHESYHCFRPEDRDEESARHFGQMLDAIHQTGSKLFIVDTFDNLDWCGANADGDIGITRETLTAYKLNIQSLGIRDNGGWPLSTRSWSEITMLA